MPQHCLRFIINSGSHGWGEFGGRDNNEDGGSDKDQGRDDEGSSVERRDEEKEGINDMEEGWNEEEGGRGQR